MNESDVPSIANIPTALINISSYKMFYESATAGRAASYKSRSAANLAIIPLFLVPVSRSLLILLLLLSSQSGSAAVWYLC
jgi:hypothetical protein